MLTIILDLETAPIADVEAYLPDVAPRKGTKDEAKQLAQVAEKREALVRDAGLDPDLSRIVCLGTIVDGVAAVRVCQSEDIEHSVLTGFWETLRSARGDYRIIGYNLLAFDLPRLYRRSLYLDVPAVTMTRDKYRHPNVIDLLDILSEQGRFTFRSLEYYCKRFALDVPSDDITGDMIAGLVAAGDWAAVKAHNAADLAKTRALAERLGVIDTARTTPVRKLANLDIGG